MTADDRIHGPSQALAWHIAVHDRFARALDHSDRMFDAGGIPVGACPPQLGQRIRLATAMGFEGRSVAEVRDQPARATEPYFVELGLAALRAEVAMLDAAETHFVSARVMDAVTAAAATMESEPLFATDMPSPTGLIVLERPMLIGDIHPDTGETCPGLHVPVRAIGWHTGKVGVQLDGADVDPVQQQGMTYVLYTEASSWRAHYATTHETLVGYPIEPEAVAGANELQVWNSDMSGWAFDTPWAHRELSATVTDRRRWLLAYFRWTFSRVLVHQVHQPSRAERKLNDRRRTPLRDGGIKIVRLRREVEVERARERGEVIEWDHSWMVRGHWRRQHYPSLGPARRDGVFNQDSHRLVWIEPHVKGDGPLVAKHNVSAAIR